MAYDASCHREGVLGESQTRTSYGRWDILVYRRSGGSDVFRLIDSTLKRLDGEAYQRFAPRTKGSLWSELNKERCRRMERLGRMTDAGRAVLPDLSPGGFTIDKEILSALQQDPIVWRNFQNFPSLYRRVRIDTIQIKKKQPPLFESRLKKFIDNTRLGIMYSEWNDNGRLIE